MNNPIFRLNLYTIVVYLTGFTFNLAIAATQSLVGNRTHFSEVIGHQQGKQHSDQFSNRRYAQATAANLNVGAPRTVRMIYFLPNDRPYRVDAVQWMKDVIRTVQTFYAEQMDARGYGKVTFRVETDLHGNPIVHRRVGQYSYSHYLDRQGEINEIEQAFDLNANIYLIVTDRHVARGVRQGKNGGYGWVSADLSWDAVAHELGHAFGLRHDFRDGKYIMSNGLEKYLLFARLSPCHTRYLSVHPYFNPDTPIEEGPPPTIELISPRTYPVDSKSVPIRLKIRDSDGVHQVFLYAEQPNSRATVKACRALRGREEADIEFAYDGVVPSAHEPSYSISTSLLNPLVHPIGIEVVDVNGNLGRADFVLFSETLQPMMKILGDNQRALPNTPLPFPFVVEMRDLNDGFARDGVPVTFVVIAGGGTLSATRTTTDENGRAQSTLTLGPDLGTNTVEVSAAGITVSFNAVARAAANFPDPNLRAVIELDIGVAPGSPIVPEEMTALIDLEAPKAKIRDLTGLELATNITRLQLWGNTISDISAVEGLTNLTQLNLGSNTISDISAVGGLTNLTQLALWGNTISDISAVGGLTNLTQLNLGGNTISDISAVAALTNLKELWLWSNTISDISAMTAIIKLVDLDLSHNTISDISPLVANVGLGSGDTVNVRGNPLSHLSLHTHLPALQSRGVMVEFDNRTHPALLKISGDNQKGASFASLSQPFVVEAQDENGFALAGIMVTFTVIGGDGTLSTQSITTDPNGRAESILTMGPNLGRNTVQVSATGIESTVTFYAIADTLPTEYLWSIPSGYSLIHVPLSVTIVDGVEQTITSIGDLYDALGGADTVTYLITLDSQTQEWSGYFSPSDRGTPADRRLTNDMGIIARLITPVLVHLTGSPLGTSGSSTITLNPGYNIVGLPLRDSRVTRVSDLFTLEGIGGNVPTVIFTDNGEFKAVVPEAAGGPDDIPIIGGQAFILDVQQAATVAIFGDGWYNTSETAAAPLLSLKGVEGRDIIPVLALRGLIVDEEMGTRGTGFRVIVKNLATGRAVAATTKTRVDKEESTGVGYQVAIVDVETGRAATVGDNLEISAQSPDPFITVQPLQYTITAADVKRSLIQLPSLIAYEIPAETELLPNYPNPFNPETWIPYRLAEDAFVTLTIYDQAGHVVRTLDVGRRIAAVYESRSKAIYWDGKNGAGEQVASGVYFYHLSAGDYSATRKMVILK